MSYQVLARKWRPRLFSELVGQAHVVQALSNGLAQGRLHHAFLLTGTRGVGKTTIARILAKSLNCLEGVSAEPCGKCEHCIAIDEGRFVDLLEVDAASRTKVDDTREILDNVQYAPARGRFKVYLIDEVHMLSGHSFNALLKTLEEPPEHVKFVLATTDPQKIPVTILSRCLQFNLRRLGLEEIRDQMARILDKEGVDYETEALHALARAADGSMRDGLSLLDQALATDAERLVLSTVQDMLGTVEQRHILEMLQALADGQAAEALKVLDQAFEMARHPKQLLADLAEALHRIGLVQQVPEYEDAERPGWDALRELADRFDPEDIQLFYQIAIVGRRELEMAPDARTGCEMTLLRMFAFRPAESASGPGPAGESARKTPGAAAGSPAPSAAEAGSKAGAVREPVASPKAPEKPVNPTTPAASGEGEQDLDWITIFQELEISGAVRTVCSHLDLRQRGESQWVFSVNPDHAMLFSDRTRKSFQAALSSYLNRDIRVRVETNDDKDVMTPARIENVAADRRQQQAEESIHSDPVVQGMKEQLGASVISESIEPDNHQESSQ